jgi:hypothetical protein
MSAHDAVWLVLLNTSILGIGTASVGLLFGGTDAYRTAVERMALGYALGFAIVAIAIANLALLDVAVGPRGLLLSAFALTTLDIACRARRSGRAFGWPRGRPSLGRDETLVLVGISAIVGTALVGFAQMPLKAWDGWAIWAARARFLYDWGGASSPPFTNHAYLATHLDYPLVLPSLEALVFRSLGRFDGRLVHIELVCLLAAFLVAMWVLLRKRGPSPVVALMVLSIGASPAMLGQLASNYADIPLAFFISLGLVTLLLAVESRNWRLICVATLFLSCASLVKNEGLVFAALALVSAWLVFPKTRWMASLAGLGVLLVVAPWQIFVAVHGISSPDFRLTNLANVPYVARHSGRAAPAADSLTRSIIAGWDALPILVGLALMLALVHGFYRRSLFLVTWLSTSFIGLVGIYVISRIPIREHLDQSADRVVASLVIGAAALTPLLIPRRAVEVEPRGEHRGLVESAAPTRDPA